MEIREFIRRAQAQPVIEVERTIKVAGPTLTALMKERRGMLVSEYTAHPDQHSELRRFRYGHVLGPGLADSALDDWQARHPEHRLPADLRAFLTHVNGIHLWADLECSRAYFGVEPIEKWKTAAESLWASMFQQTAGKLVLSYHDNGDYILVLDTLSCEYRWHDLEDFDDFTVLGSTVEAFLDSWWEETAWLDPREEEDPA